MAKKSKAERRASSLSKKTRKKNSAVRMAELRALRGTSIKSAGQKSSQTSIPRVIVQTVAAPLRRVLTVRSLATRGKAMAGQKLQRLRQFRTDKGIDIRGSLKQAGFASAGGATSAVIDGITVYSKTKNDDSTLLRFVVKAGGAMVIQGFVGKSSSVRDFFSGMTGHAAGTALEEYVTAGAKALRIKRDLEEAAEKISN